jgi:tetratricopeptide (TPR) repeat protein
VCSILFTACEPTTGELLNQAANLETKEMYKEAAEVYTKVINRNSRIQLAWFRRGICMAHLNNYSVALHDFNKVITLKTPGGLPNGARL